jgi:chitin-binding protein
MHLSHRAVLALSAVVGLALSGSAFAHGTLSKPLSRVKQCHEGNPENPTNPPAPPPRPSAAPSRSTTGPASTRPTPTATIKRWFQMASCAAAATASTAASI